MNIFRALACAGLMICSAHVLGATTQSIGQTNLKTDAVSFVKPSEDDLLLLSLVLEEIDLTDEIEAYRNGAGVLLPLGAICRLLEIAVRTTPADGTAEGFVGRSSRTFSLDVRQKRIKVSGKDEPYDPAYVQVQRNDIYVDYRALNKWLALGIEINENGLAIYVNPKDQLPLQRRLRRENLANQLNKGEYHDPGFARVPNPYQALGSPAIDQSLSFGDAEATRAKSTSIRYDAQFASDFAEGSLDGSLDLESRTGPAGLLSFVLKNQEGGLLGSLNARQETIGYTTSLDLPLVSSSHAITGFAASNDPVSQVGPAKTTTLTGPLQPGWDVELFRGEALIGYQEENGPGKYEFKNVALHPGTNKFRLIFDGPLGERREEVQTRNVVGTLEPGSLQYEAVIGGSASSPEWAAQSSLGIKRDLTVFTSIASEPVDGGRHLYSTVGMRGYFANALITTCIVDDPASGQASQIDGEWAWGRAFVGLSQTNVTGLVSGIYGREQDPDRSDTELRLQNLTMPNWSHLLPADLEISRRETVFGTQEWKAEGRLSYQRNGLSITNMTSTQTQTGTTDHRTGELMFSRFQNGHSTEANLNYDWSGTPTIVSLGFRTSRVLRDGRMLAFGAYESPGDGDLGVTGSLYRNDDNYAYGLILDVSRARGIMLGLTISFGMVRNPSSGKWMTTARSQAMQGSVLIRVFQDSKGTGHLAKGDARVAGVAIYVNDSAFPKLTGPDGTVLIDGLAAYQPADIKVVEASMENPLMISALPGLRITPRPGNVQTIDMPVIATAEVAGTVYTLQDRRLSAASGVLVEVIDRDGRVVLSQRSAFDGYYSISRVPVGSYAVRAKAFGVETSKKIVVPPEGAYLDGIDLTLSQ
ncbi:MAG: carboxypeptidase-like regulatory domain-containing protein [Fimbriimonas sp.]|nr:carboxypeptidase-like regulatory domain-containing protein [Fimbriimonas sp.]